MKPLHFIFLFVFGIFHSQNKEFTYYYTSIKDSTKKDEKFTEPMILNVGEKESFFYAFHTNEFDSLIVDSFKKESRAQYALGDERNINNIRVKKSLPSNKILFYNSIQDLLFKVEETINWKWDLKQEKDTILGYPVQKATTQYGGRKWIVWFASDIPIPDGPYKFFGLPGLILKVHDTGNNHIFELKGIKNKKTPFKFSSTVRFSKMIQANYKKYELYFRSFRKDPSNIIPEGAIIENAHERKEYNDYWFEKFKKDNNIIEIDLLE